MAKGIIDPMGSVSLHHRDALDVTSFDFPEFPGMWWVWHVSSLAVSSLAVSSLVMSSLAVLLLEVSSLVVSLLAVSS